MKENQRVRLSKQMLRESLINLMSSKSIHKISVREICDSAEINRTTFYKYYGSQYDLLKDIENEMLDEIESYLNTDEPDSKCNHQSLYKVITYFENNLALCRILINNTIDTEFAEKLLSLPKIHILIKEQLKEEYNENDLAYVIHFILNGSFSFAKNWINKENRETPEEISALLTNILSKIFPSISLY